MASGKLDFFGGADSLFPVCGQYLDPVQKINNETPRKETNPFKVGLVW